MAGDCWQQWCAYTIVCCGWQHDVLSDTGRLGIRVRRRFLVGEDVEPIVARQASLSPP